MMRREEELVGSTSREVFSNATSFEDKCMLRGTDICHVMRCCGRILANNDARAESYLLSRPVVELDWFISHNWSVRRFVKFCCLVLHFNLRCAVLATCVTAIFLNVVRCLRGKPFVPHVQCLLFGNICFLVVLFFLHELLALLPGDFRGLRLFLDKTCIHQTDPKIMANGVKKLAAFLMFSKNFFAIFTEEYLQKAWTVYELAIYLLLHKGERLVLMNVQTANMVICGSQCFFVFLLSFRVSSVVGGAATAGFRAIFSFGFLACAFLFKIVRTANTMQAMLLERIKTFTLAAAKCTVESDREIIHKNISAFMIEIGPATEWQSQEHILTAFDRIVQTELPRHIDAARIPYKHVLVIFMSQLLFGMDAVGSSEYPWFLPTLLDGATHSVLWLAVYPNSMELACALVRQRTDLQGFCEKLLIIAAVFVFMCWSTFSWFALFHFQQQSLEGQSWATGAFFGSTMAQFGLTLALYRPAVQLAAGSGALAENELVRTTRRQQFLV
eukprot:TRINITY_DN10218_c0_g1_i3.p1 TRINITY_DN10218_c0_g1~~TRINITY_DN10218_c0_g1_i3.p1  ORF type:complete len:500 (+),score=59.27 TRINITY_DN10218_c0_g1_i3:92-1591(+)